MKKLKNKPLGGLTLGVWGVTRKPWAMKKEGVLFNDTDFRHFLTRGLLTPAWGDPAWVFPGTSPCPGPCGYTGWLGRSQGPADWAQQLWGRQCPQRFYYDDVSGHLGPLISIWGWGGGHFRASRSGWVWGLVRRDSLSRATCGLFRVYVWCVYTCA